MRRCISSGRISATCTGNTLMGAFSVPAPISTVIMVFFVVLVILWLLSLISGGFGGVGGFNSINFGSPRVH